jgi:hypothetical protein
MSFISDKKQISKATTRQADTKIKELIDEL